MHSDSSSQKWCLISFYSDSMTSERKCQSMSILGKDCHLSLRPGDLIVFLLISFITMNTSTCSIIRPLKANVREGGLSQRASTGLNRSQLQANCSFADALLFGGTQHPRQQAEESWRPEGGQWRLWVSRTVLLVSGDGCNSPHQKESADWANFTLSNRVYSKLSTKSYLILANYLHFSDFKDTFWKRSFGFIKKLTVPEIWTDMDTSLSLRVTVYIIRSMGLEKYVTCIHHYSFIKSFSTTLKTLC